MAARDEQIGKRTGHEQVMRVLFEPAIAHLGKAEYPFDNPDGMFDLGPYFRLGAVFGPLDLIDNTTVTVAAIGEIQCPGRMLPDHHPLAAIRLVTPDAGFVAMQQIGQHRAVSNMSRRGLDCVDQLAAAVDPEMRLHPKVPLVSLLGLMHLGIARPCRHSWSKTAH